MTRNVGGGDRWFRIAFGTAGIVLGMHQESWWGALALVPLLTGLIGWCPVYVPFHVSTREDETNPHAHA